MNATARNVATQRGILRVGPAIRESVLSAGQRWIGDSFPSFSLSGIILIEVKMPTKSQIKEAYDSVTEDYDDYMEVTGHAQAQRKMVELLKEDIRGKVLDVGTGTGIIALEIAEKLRNCEVFASDISEKMLEQGLINREKMGLCVNFITDDMEESPLVDDQFDTVICCLGMLWFIDKDKALSEMARICKANGKIILIEEEGQPTRSRKPAFSKRLQSFFSKIEKLETPISLKEIEEKMEGLGYQVTRIAKERIDEDHGFVAEVFEVISSPPPPQGQAPAPSRRARATSS